MEHEYIGTEDFLDGVQKVTIRRQPSSKQAFGCGWLRVLEDGLPALCNLTPGESKVFWHLALHMTVTNRLHGFSQKELAKALGTSEPRVSRVVGTLKNFYGLVRGGRDCLMVDPRVVYKGQTADYADVLAKWNALEN